MLRGITILSPHRDDAIFSIFLSLSHWSEQGIRLRVVNFFTISAYAPHAAVSDTNQVSFVRRQEDRKALARISPSIEVIDENLLDAPIRLNISARDISKPGTHALLTGDQIETVAKRIIALGQDWMFMTPLGLGDHVDHLAVRSAAMQSIASHRVAFYEDLPYATWTPKEALRSRVSETEGGMAMRLKPMVIRSLHAVWHKRLAAALYQSQITPEEADNIARWSAQYRGGERIWVPRNSNTGSLLFETRNAAFCR